MMNKHFKEYFEYNFAYRSIWNRFLAMVLAVVILITSINIDTYVLNASEQTRTEVMDVTDDEDYLKLMYTEWWYGSDDDVHLIAEQNDTINMSEYTAGEDEYTSKQAGLSLEYSAQNVLSGDTFEVMFPETFAEVRVDNANINDDIDCSLDVLNTDNEHETRLTVTFSGDGDHHGVIPIEFHFTATDEVTLVLQHFPKNTIEYKLIPPLQDQRSVIVPEDNSSDDTQSGDVTEQADDGEAETVTVFKENHFSINAKVLFNDKTDDGTDWSSLIRPQEFNQKIVLEAQYTDKDGAVHTKKIYAQDDQPKDNFYLMVTHDGEGGGSVEISDVPNYITLDGDNYPVTKYKVNVESELPYYESNGFDVDIDENGQTTAVISTLEIHVKSRKLNIATEVVGDNTARTFDVNVAYTNEQQDVNVKDRSLKKIYKVSSDNSSKIDVPVGLGYEVSQTAADGYKLSPDYRFETKKDDSEEVETSSKQAPVSGTIAGDEDVTITSINYSQNRTFSFNVAWIDNNSTNRPELTSKNFNLQYKTDEGEWTAVTEDALKALGIDKLPAFNTSKSAEGIYSYTGLPGVDADGSGLEYRIQPADVPAKYDVSVDADGKNVTYREITDFNATISWLDNKNKPGKRPEADTLSNDLRLYRRTDSGSYEEVSGVDIKNSITVSDGSDNWTVNIKELPRYNDNNQEYDYVLIQGSIGSDNKINQIVLDNYKTYYNNGTGNYGNDTQLCHDNGKITERIYAVQDFSVKKIWKDTEAEKEKRPEAVVTLWRYAVANEEDDRGIDEMYKSGKAAKVIYRKPETADDGTITYSDVLLSYKLDNTKDTETIAFDHSTVEGMPEGLKLPVYDEQGHKYVYFVRETLADETYETSYSEDQKQGVANGGTITNTRREKAAVNVTKQWKCPSDLTNIDGTSIQFVIKAPLKGEDASVLHELAVYSSETGSYDILTGADRDNELAISGFSSSVTSLSSMVYVNIYDEDGMPYDMTKAVIEEVYVNKAGSGDTEESIKVTDGSFTLNGSTYKVASEYVSDGKINGDISLYSYAVSNTITGKRDYTVTKVWGSGITEKERNSVKRVNFSLTRQSTKDGSKPENVNGEFYVVNQDGKNTWTNVFEDLDKYDADGYAYQYQATELSVVLNDDSVVSPSSKGWAVEYTRTLDETRTVNYRSTGGVPYLRIHKNWNDNGDVAARKSVNVRIYRKSDLKAALDKIVDKSEDISLDDLDIVCADYSNMLRSDNNWYYEISLRDIEKDMGNSDYDDNNLSYADYVALEYSVGTGKDDGAVASEYTYDGLLQMTGSDKVISLSGYTRNSLRQYDISVSRSGDNGDVFTITNTRTGNVTLNINKKWYDENNKEKIRPADISFQVYRNGEKYTPEDSLSVTVSSDSTTGKETVKWDPDTGVITLTGDSEDPDWKCSIKGLPLFSDFGTTYTYSVVETGTPDNYLSEQLAATTEKTDIPDDIVYIFGFKNTASAVTSHYALKYWHDAATGGEDRPDLYMVLYRYVRSDLEAHGGTDIEKLDTYEQFNGYKDQNWEKGMGSSAGGYDWKIEVSDLPKYDDRGREYVYLFKERMNNDGTNVYGTYKSTSKTVNGHEEFTNTITDEMTVSGDKAWLGLSGYKVTEDDLPAPTIQLYRSLKDISLLNKSETEIESLIQDGTITLVNETVMDKNKYRFAFPDVNSMSGPDIEKAIENGYILYNSASDSYTLPKFDDNGNRYVYMIYEKLDGTAGQLYSQVSARGTLNNTFRSDVNRRTIRVQKKWDGRTDLTEKEKRYPSVTYKLYRYVKNKGSETAQLYDSVKIPASNFEKSDDGEYSYDFKDLLVYSPSGEEYGYYVTENGIKGYSVSYSDEQGITDGYADNDRCDVISVPDNALTSGEQSITTIGTTNSYSDAGRIIISGSKYWNDYGNSNKIYGHRPESINVKLYRYTQHESGQTNKVDSEEIAISVKKQVDETVTLPYIVWSVSENDPNRWNYTIYNLEQYAPNGMPYVYSVVEEADAAAGYNHSRKTVEATANSDKIQMKEIVNSFDGKYYVRKNWMDGNNKYGLRPSSVTIVLQRRVSDTDEWQNIAWDESIGSYNETTGTWTGLPSVTRGDVNGNDTDIVSVKLTAANVINNTRGNSWAYTFTNLPEYNPDGNKWEYRCIETMVGSVEVTETTSGEGEVTYTAGAYTRTYTEQSASATVVQNRLKSTSLLVTKEWTGDEDDQYHTRPDSLSFVLQMRGIKPDSIIAEDGDDLENTESSGESDGSDGDGQLTDWKDVILADGRPYTFTISKKDNWTKLLEDLPVATVGSDGKTYYNLYFRAKEVHSDNDSNLVKGALNYKDITSYALESADHKYNKDASRNESVIKNELIRDADHSSISVTKKWNRRSGEEKTAEIELLYKSADDSTWHCMGDADNCTSGGSDGCRKTHDTADGCVIKNLTSDRSGTDSFTWDELPMYDRQGNILEYKVVEHDIAGYTTDIQSQKKDDKASYDTDYVFTNTELQHYTVKKLWKNTEYAERDRNGSFTAVFKLQQRVATATDADWEDIGTTADGEDDPYVITLTSDKANSSSSYIWDDLPEYTVDGREIVYRAVEIRINDTAVDQTSNSSGSYIVTYQYGSGEDSAKNNVPEFADTVTFATNRMVYGFVNMSKSAAYLTSGTVLSEGTVSTDKKLENVTFDIYRVILGNVTSTVPYITGVHTDSKGNLVCNEDGTYGTGADSKYLISGTYKIVETGTRPGYSVWNDGIEFNVGTGNGTTGEHGTAWIYTLNELATLSLKVTYVQQMAEEHDLSDACRPLTNTDNAYNLESRGVIEFTKTGSDGKPLCVHDKSIGESKVYFGVYTDADCTDQVAGMMADTDGTSIVLSTMDRDGVTDISDKLLTVKNDEGIPYLRRDNNRVLTLLSGTYYIKEIVAPAGYKLDTVIRKAIVPEIKKTDIDSPLNDVYTSNKAKIMLASETNGVSDYRWANVENKVVIYKRDQYGKIVKLKKDGYLELVTENNTTFLTGESSIRLYQNASSPAMSADGKEFDSTNKPDISYDEKSGSWTITGLFDTGKTYTLTEPEESVPESNIIAKNFVFTMNEDGTISVPDADTDSKEITGDADPLGVKGDDHQNYYKSAGQLDVIVMRDVSRYLADVTLKKIDADTGKAIANISFELYRYDGLDESGNPVGSRAVLADKQYLTTGADGIIDLEKTAEGMTNLLTGCDLKYGIETGRYYFKEVERGASDKYRLSDNIYFEVRSKEPAADNAEYKDYAEVVFATVDGFVTQESGSRQGTVSNTPVTQNNKTLELIKTDSENGEIKLADARFVLTYTSINDGTEGRHDKTVQNCITDSDGILYVADDSWNILTDSQMNSKTQPDISKKGHYVLTEVLAPDYYMTRTDDNSKPVVMVSFDVDSTNNITNIVCYGSNGELVSATDTKENNESIKLAVQAKNEKTIVSIGKRNDIESSAKTADQTSVNGEMLSGAELAIYEGIYDEQTPETGIRKDLWTTDGQVHEITSGTLKENTVYTLHEEKAPVGYLASDDIYFKIFGTTARNGQIISQIYVWTGNGMPDVTSKDGWSVRTSLNDKILTMVDEAVIAPVDVQKVVGNSNNYKVLPGAKFEVMVNGKDSSDNMKFGTAVSNAQGYLVWDTIETSAYDKKLIYNEDGRRVTLADSGTVTGKTIILQQNEYGYTFTEVSSPDNAYNEGKSFKVNITADNYKAYRIGIGKYDTNKYIDIVKANTDSGHTVSELSERNDRDKAATADDLVNPPFEAAFELYKYDAENPDINADHDNYDKIGLEGVEFTLYKRQDNGTYNSGKAYLTGDNGLLHIDITEKGTYKLVETKPLDGYNNNNKELIFTIVNDDYKKTLSYSDIGSADEKTHTVVVKDAAGVPVAGTSIYDMENNRMHGTVTLLKVDPDSNKKLNGVKYTLTRTAPDINEFVDGWFPVEQKSLTVETGKTYNIVSMAKDKTDYDKGITGNNAADTGKLIVKDLQWGTYQLVETQELDGYIISTKIYTFEITQNNRIKWIFDNDDTKTDVQNKKNQLTIKKTDMDSRVLSGAQFSIYSVKDDTVSNEPVKFYTSADRDEPDGTVITAGTTTVYGIPSGTYVLKEIKAPAGYELTQDVKFTMGKNGEVSGVGNCKVDTDGKVSDDSDSVGMVSFTMDNSGNTVTNTITVKDNPIEIILTKKLVTGKPIAGRGDAVYEIKGVDDAVFADGKTASKTFTGNNIQEELKAQLVAGCRYTITEVTAPAGYEVPRKPAVISVAADGKLTVEECGFLTADNSEADGIARLVFTDGPIELTLSKVDGSANEINQNDLGYAKFSVTGKLVSEDGSRIEDEITVTGLTTQDFSTALSGRLIANEIYKVEETKAPDGYKLTKPFYIMIDANGRIAKRGEDRNELSKEAEPGDKLVVVDTPISVTFKKVDENNNPVSGAVFTLTRAAGSTVDKAFVNMSPDTKLQEADTWTESEIKWVSTNNSAGITFTNHLIAGVKYKLHEDRVLYHEVMTDDIEFTVKPDGKVIIDKNSSIPNNEGMDAAELDADQVVMTIRNPVIKGTVVLTKYWKENSSAENIYNAEHVLEGAVYTLKMVKDASGTDIEPEVVHAVRQSNGTYAYMDGSSDATDRFITDSKGQIYMAGLPEGTYEFLETDAPKAYHINNDDSQKIQFTIKNAEDAHVTLPEQLAADDKEKLMDIRINAKISLVKYTGGDGSEHLMKNALFDVAYSDADKPEDKDYASIGRMVTGEDGKAEFSKGIYPKESTSEGLRRGHYRLTELAADDQMLNATDGTRNKLYFEIGNEIDHEYAVNSRLQTYLNEKKLDGLTVSNSRFISLTDTGVVDVPIPTKTVTVTKKWSGDDNILQTFRPESIKVQLYRTYSDSNNVLKKEKVGEQIDIKPDSEGQWSYRWNNLPAYVNIPASEKSGEETYVTRLYKYTVEEVKVPTGYTVSYVNTTEVSDKLEDAVEDGNTDSVITNTINKTQTLTIRKVLGGGSDEDTFQIRVRLTNDGKPFVNNYSNQEGYYLDNYTLYDGDQDTSGTKHKPDDDGYMKVKGGEYVTIEIPANITYEVEEKLDSGQPYVTGDKSELKYTPRYVNKTGTIDKIGQTAVIRNAVHKSLSITKYDVNKETLAGAVFRIDYTPLAGGSDVDESYVKEYKTNSAGTLVDQNSEAISPQLTKQGTYRIYEIDAPDGYIVPTNIDGTPILLATITVDADDVMSIESNYTDIAEVKLAKNDSVAELEVTDIPISIDIAKVDQATKQLVSGVTLKLSKLASDNSWTPVNNAAAGSNADGIWTTADNAVTFSGSEITAGVYKLEETEALNGYNPVAAPLVFRVDKAGRVAEVSLLDITSGGYKLSNLTETSDLKNYTIINSDDGTAGAVRIDIFNAKYTDLEIMKKDPDGVVLPDVEFMLEYKDSNNSWQKVKLSNGQAEVKDQIPVTGDEISAKLSTDQNGIVTFGNLPDGTYRLIETKTVKGYNLLSAPIEINIDRNGMIYTAASEGAGTYKLSMREGTDTLLMTVVNKKGNALPKTGTQTPHLPKAVLPVVVLVEAFMLYLYGSRGRRRRKRG